MERLLSMHYCFTEEEFVLRFRQHLEVQSSKQMVPSVQRDDRGVAFSTAEGRYTPAVLPQIHFAGFLIYKPNWEFLTFGKIFCRYLVVICFIRDAKDLTCLLRFNSGVTFKSARRNLTGFLSCDIQFLHNIFLQTGSSFLTWR